MTKDNLIPKTETVYELKSEIPSFEEFVENYEYDAKVADSYQLENQVEEKGYGPCNYKNSYCSCSCDRDDYRCNCQYDERWCKLVLSCPICPRSSSNYVREWGHVGHSDYGVRISNKARIRCNKTSCDTSDIRYWAFVCSSHNGERVSSSGSFTLAVLTAINAQKSGRAYGVDEKLMDELLVHLEKNSW